MKIYHEAPLSIFKDVQEITDGDYFLVHLFEENEKYLDFALRSKQQDRETILDNSVFELETAFNGSQYIQWIEKVLPTWYIIPDVLDNAQATIESYEKFISDFPKIPGKSIVVAQGSDFEDLKMCYNYFKKQPVDMIAFSFNHPFFIKSDDKKYHDMMNGRINALKNMLSENIIDTSRKHHLLGCSLPQEFKAYRTYSWIYSVDTSNPVIAGMKGISYKETGLGDKQSVKLFTLIDEQVTTDQYNLIQNNIFKFREFCNGKEMDRSIFTNWK